MTSEAVSKEHPHFYPERPGANIDSAILILSAPPEFMPTETEKRNAYMVESALTVGVDLYSILLNDETPDRLKVQGVEKIFLGEKVNTLDFFIQYFTSSSEGRDTLMSLGFEPENDEVHEEEVVRFLSGFDYSKINENDIAKIAGNSREFIEKMIADQMEENDFESLDGLSVPTKITVVKNPENLAGRMEELIKLKVFLKDYARSESAISSPQIRAFIDMHKRRVNELIAESYPDAIALARQHKASPNEITEKAIERISRVSIISFESDDVGAYLLARIDKYLNGAGEDMEKRDYSPVSNEAKLLANELLKQNHKKEIPEGKYEEFKDVFKETKADAYEMQKWIKKVLSEWGILSELSEDEYLVDRAGGAEDGKWQVIVHPSASGLEVNGEQRVVKIINSLNRSLAQLSPVGVVAGIDHEAGEHVVQYENKRKLEIGLLEKVGTDRFVVYREAGAVDTETQTQVELFGQLRETNTHYFKAVVEKGKGRNYLDCVMTFYRSSMKSEPDRDKKEAAIQAANRVLRLFRNEGSLSDTSKYLSNTEPLAYLEQDLVVKKLKEKRMEKLLHFGMNLDVMADLHRVGLADFNDVWVPNRKPSEILDGEIREKFEKARAN